MTDAPEAFPPKETLLTAYEAGANVLGGEAKRIHNAVDVLAPLSNDPTDEIILPHAADAVTEDGLATSAAEVMPAIQKAVEPFNPEQTDASASESQRWTMDWTGIGAKLRAKVAERPELPEQLGAWYLETAPDMVETTYGPAEEDTLYFVVGAANDQCSFRPTLTMVSMASPKFREENGLATADEHGLNGEDGREAGWLTDGEFIAELREHVKARIEAGQIEPRVFVGGSLKRQIPQTKERDGKVVPNLEYEKVKKYLNPDVPYLLPDSGLTEADAMLAGALRVYGGDASTIRVTDVASDGPDTPRNKLVRFDSEIGEITLIATDGDDAKMLRQVEIAGEQTPELFQGIDAFMGATTAIYTWGERPVLREVAAKLGLEEVQVDMLGISAHAAGIDRKLETLIGEHTKYLGSVYGVARRMLESAELNTQLDITTLEYLGSSAVAAGPGSVEGVREDER